MAAVNGWKEPEKILWLRVRLVGRAATVLMRVPDGARESYEDCMGALKKRFDPSSRCELYLAELLGRKKRRGEDWAAFAEDLNTQVDRAYPELQEDAREQLALASWTARAPPTGFQRQTEDTQNSGRGCQSNPRDGILPGTKRLCSTGDRGINTSRTSGCSERAAGRHGDPSAAGGVADGHTRVAVCSPTGGNLSHSASSSRTGGK